MMARKAGFRRRLAWGIGLLIGPVLALGLAWYAANVIDSGLRPWSPGLAPETEGLVHGAQHDGWLALVGLQPGHLTDARAQGRRSWQAWDAGRAQVLALAPNVTVPLAPAAFEVAAGSPLQCMPLPQCPHILAQRLDKLPAALQAQAPLALACEDIAAASGFLEPAALLPPALDQPRPHAALGTCARLWLAQSIVARHRQDARGALRAWSAMHKVSAGVLEGSRSMVSGLVAGAWLQAAHAQALPLVSAFPSLDGPVREALARPVPWRTASVRWWAAEWHGVDQLMLQTLELSVDVKCTVAAGRVPPATVCRAMRVGWLPPALRPVLPNFTRSRLRERQAAVVAAVDADPVASLHRLKALDRQHAAQAFPALQFRNTLRRILIDVSRPEYLALEFLPRVLDVEQSRQAALLGLGEIAKRRSAGLSTQTTQASLEAMTRGAPMLAGRVRCKDDNCRQWVLASWRTDARAPRRELTLGP